MEIVCAVVKGMSLKKMMGWSILKEQRMAKIIAYLKKYQKATISELAELLGVSEMTIRRDVEVLTDNQLVKRIRGAVILERYESNEVEYDIRLLTDVNEKKKIAAKASEFIEEGDTIFLDSGTTTIHLVPYLHEKKNLTVIINDFEIYEQLKDMKNCRVIFAGGALHNDYESITSGIHTQAFYEQFYANKAFIAVMSVDLKNGLFHSTSEVAYTKKAMIDNADKIIVLVDHKKFESRSTYRIVKMDQVDTIITDCYFDESLYPELNNIQIIKTN